VHSVRPVDDGFSVATSQGRWTARNVVVASGANDRPNVPSIADRLSRDVTQLTTATYRNPTALPPGGVLVVGASASGVQIADELRRAGRRVVLAVGRHTRLPRRYRGMDVMWWLSQMGVLDKPVDESGHRGLAHHEPSLQLIGRPGGSAAQYEVDLVSLQRRGIWLAGHLAGIDGDEVTFADDLARTTAAADSKLHDVLDRIDEHVRATGMAGEVDPACRPDSLPVEDRPLTGLRLQASGISTVVWATGYRRCYPWLQVPVLDGAGEIRQSRGVTSFPGLYTVGQRWQSRRNSSFIDGARHDAALVAEHVAAMRKGCRLAAA